MMRGSPLFSRAAPPCSIISSRRTSVAFVPPPVHPDYHAQPGAALGGRALGALPFDGRKLGEDFARVRPPRREFMVLGGMMVGKTDIPSLLHPFHSLGKFCERDRACWRGRRWIGSSTRAARA